MGFPLFKFTLNNTIEGSLEIHEPEGWDNGVLKLERNKDYHSLVEYYDQPLLFDDAEGNGLPGGLAYIKNIENTQGIDAQIDLTIEISEDEGDTYETCFEGVLDIATIKEVDFYKLECGIKRNDFWSKFINRKSIPVDLSASVDLDGNAITPVDSFELPLPSQRIRERTNRQESFGTALYEGDVALNDYIQFSFDNKILDEVKNTYTLVTSINPSVPVPIFDVLLSGNYEFTIKVELSIKNEAGTPPGDCSSSTFVSDPTSAYIDLYFQKNSETPILFSTTDFLGQSTVYEYTDSHDLVVGDEIRVYGIVSSVAWKLSNVVDHILVWGNDNTEVSLIKGNFAPTGGGGACEIDSTFFSTKDFNDPPSGNTNPTTFEITADTTYPDTTTDAFLLIDAGESILSKLTGIEDVLTSDELDELGCYHPFALTRGLNVRGYSFYDDETVSPTISGKPFFMSFDQWWNGANPVFNLGLGYERSGSPETDKIRIEPKEYFYDKAPSLNLDFVNNIERSYNLDYIFKSIEIGYNKWSAESASGVDDPQSKRTWRTRFATVGKDEKVLSQFIAASLAIEQTRRNRVEQGKDWRLDEEIMIIALSEGSPLWTPELDENFSDVTNLLNSDSRYNIRLSVARNFQRWLNFFNGCLQIPGGDEFIFSSGEGNFDMLSTLVSSDCEATGDSPEPELDEKGNVSVTDDFLFTPIVYEFEHPLTYEEYKTIRDNKTKAIGISRSDSDHKACFIMNLDYKPTRGLGTFTVILGENDPL